IGSGGQPVGGPRTMVSRQAGRAATAAVRRSTLPGGPRGSQRPGGRGSQARTLGGSATAGVTGGMPAGGAGRQPVLSMHIVSRGVTSAGRVALPTGGRPRGARNAASDGAGRRVG